MTDVYELIQVSPEDVEFSKENPRGENPDEIKNDKTFEQLKDSVAQFGVLVPVVVHRQGGRSGKKYMLIDGERRLRAALATGREKIPAHVATAPDRMSELVQAFHIHMLRKQWKPVATARALNRIKSELRKKRLQKSDKELLKELQVSTGCTNKQLQDLQRGIKYSESVLKEVDDGTILWSHLVQNESSFVEQLEQHYSRLLKNLGVEKVRKVLVKKARKKIINTRSLMLNVVPVIARAKSEKEKRVVEKLLENFIKTEDMTAEQIKKEFERHYPPPQDLIGLADNIVDTGEDLKVMLGQIDVSEVVSFHKKAIEVKRILEDLKRAVGRTLRQLTKLIS